MNINLDKKLVDTKGNEIPKTIGECFVEMLNQPDQALDKKKVKERMDLVREIGASSDMDFELDQLSLLSGLVGKMQYFISIQEQLYNALEVTEVKKAE